MLTDWALALLSAKHDTIVRSIRDGMARVGAATGAQRVVAYRYLAGADEVEAVYEWHDDSVASVRGAVYRAQELPVAMAALHSGDVIAIAASDEHTRFRQLRGLMKLQGTKACILAPVREGPQLRWIFIVEWREKTPAFDDALVSFATRAAAVFGAGDARARALGEQAETETKLQDRQKLETLGVVAGGMVHDFNNVLQVVLGLSELADQHITSSDGREILSDLRDTVARASDLTQRFLVFSRHGTRKRTNVNVVEALREITKLARSAIPEDRLIESSFGGENLRVFMARSDLDQAILNLCTNASDAMPGGGRIHIECGPVEDDDTKIQITVTDDGEGMSPETLQRACEPFFTTKAANAGTGLGLATIKRTIEAHAGSLEISSELGVGTRVRIVLPRSLRADAPDKPDAPVVAQGNESVLVVEDEPMVRRVTASHLERAGYTVYRAANGEEGADLLRRKRDEIALVVTDVIMPAMGGAELHDTAVKEGTAPPFLFTTGYDAGKLATWSRARGHHDVLSKPYSARDLLRSVRALLDDSRPA